MKNIIIILLVFAVGVLGYLYTQRDPAVEGDKTVQTSQPSSSAPTNTKALDLSHKNLSTISKELLDNSSITVLDVSGNNLTGALPAEIRKMTNLEELDASNNRMTGIPAEIGQLSKLRIANFSQNNISGLPLEIGNLKSLQTLDLRGNPNVSKHDISQIQSKIPNAKILTD